MAKVSFKRYETDLEATTSDIIDGQFIVTKEGTSYIDYGEDRVAFGGLSYNEVFNFLYPVGSYYETSDTTFNPNVSWGGTWVLDSAGKVTVAKDENDTDFDTLGKTGGSKGLQEHNHKFEYSTNNGSTWNDASFGRDGSISGEAKYNGTSSSVSTFSTYQTRISNTGTGDSGNLQPYIVVNRWHRTA